MLISLLFLYVIATPELASKVCQDPCSTVTVYTLTWLAMDTVGSFSPFYSLSLLFPLLLTLHDTHYYPVQGQCVCV